MLALVMLVVAVFSLARGDWLVGGVSLVVAVVLVRFFVWTTQRAPEGRVAQLAAGASGAARGRAGFAWVSLASWSTAGREALRLRRLQHHLEHEQRDRIHALGDAVFRDDAERVEQLKAEAHACAEQIEEHARDLRLALEAARERVSRERVAIAPTELVAPDPGETLAVAAPQDDK